MKYPHYLDTVIHGLEVIKVGDNTEMDKDIERRNDFISVFSGPLKDKCVYGYTSLDDDLLVPRGYYGSDDGIPVIFDSLCTHGNSNQIS